MDEKNKYEQWKETQLQWDDTDFLKNEANSFMKKRWERLNETAAKIISKEVVKKNEYVRCLDIGAGRGDFFKFVKDVVKKYYGVEPSGKMLKYEIKENDFELVRGSGEKLNCESIFDVCLIKEVLDHCFDPKKVIENSFKALDTDGIIIITLTNKDAYYKKIFKKKARRLEKKHTDHLYNFNVGEIKNLLIESGFVVEKELCRNYLRMPFFMEEMLGKLPKKIVFGILDFTDFLGSILLKESGGSFIVLARKKDIFEKTGE